MRATERGDREFERDSVWERQRERERKKKKDEYGSVKVYEDEQINLFLQ